MKRFRTPNKMCDCGVLGVKRDGSGWYCLECEAMQRRVAEEIHKLIVYQRGGELDSEAERRSKFGFMFEAA